MQRRVTLVVWLTGFAIVGGIALWGILANSRGRWSNDKEGVGISAEERLGTDAHSTKRVSSQLIPRGSEGADNATAKGSGLIFAQLFRDQKISRIEWEDFWRRWAQQDWQTCMGELAQRPDWEIPMTRGRDLSRLKGFLAGISEKDIGPALEAAYKRLDKYDFACFCKIVFQRDLQSSMSQVVQRVAGLPNECDTDLIGRAVSHMLVTNGEVTTPITTLLGANRNDALNKITEMAITTSLSAQSITLEQKQSVLGVALRSDLSEASIGKAVEAFSTTSPAESCQFLAANSNLLTSGRPLATAMGAWAAMDPSAAGEWLEGQRQSGQDVNWLIAGYVAAIREENSEAQSMWSALIADPAAKQFSAETTYLRWDGPPVIR